MLYFQFMNYKYPRITTDGAIIKDKKILLIKRKNNPYKDKWALPGGFVEYKERVEDAVVREVFEETGLKTKVRDLIGIYSDPNRDPRGHTITIVYLLDILSGELKSGDDAYDANFFDLKDLPELAFDHDIILKDVIRRMV
jgi:8-oxo-dGTP diphosphatase